MRLILLLCSLSSYAAFQSRFEVHSGLRARLLEHVASTAPRLSFTHQSSKGRRHRSCGDMSPLHSDNDKENDIIHAGSLDAANEFDDVLDKVDVGLESLPDDVREELYSNQPSEMIVLKNLLGINIFTYILAAAIAFFFSMNLILGPGWLGNSIGLEGTGSFQKVSDSLPEIIDLSNSDFLL